MHEQAPLKHGSPAFTDLGISAQCTPLKASRPFFNRAFCPLWITPAKHVASRVETRMGQEGKVACGEIEQGAPIRSKSNLLTQIVAYKLHPAKLYSGLK